MTFDAPEPERIFEEPWHAEAFALAVHLHDRGVFTWPEWSQALGSSLRTIEPTDGSPQCEQDSAGPPASGNVYYAAWLAALQSLLEERGIAGRGQVDDAVEDWREAYLRTPHGEPVELRVKDDTSR